MLEQIESLTAVAVVVLATVTALTVAALRGVNKIKAEVTPIKAEVTPNHGSSMKDQAARTEVKVDLVLELVRSQGHQIGELRDTADQIHEDHAARIRNLESRL